MIASIYQIVPGWHNLLLLGVQLVCLRGATNFLLPKKVRVSKLEALLATHFLAFCIACFARICGEISIHNIALAEAVTLGTLSNQRYLNGIYLAVIATVFYSLLLIIGEIRSKRAHREKVSP